MTFKKRIKKTRERFIEFIIRHQFPVMILGVILITIILTSTSIALYVSSGAINIDLSRPGYESIRHDTAQDEGDDEEPFSASGAIDGEARDDFLRRINNLQSDMEQVNNFGGDSLSDQSLNLE